MDSRGPFGFRGSLQDMLMVVSDKTNVLIVSTASGTETERKINLPFREVKKCRQGKKRRMWFIYRTEAVHMQNSYSGVVSQLQTSSKYFEEILVSSWLSCYASRQKNPKKTSNRKTAAVIYLNIYSHITEFLLSLSFLIRISDVSLIGAYLDTHTKTKTNLCTLPIGKSFLEQKLMKEENPKQSIISHHLQFCSEIQSLAELCKEETGLLGRCPYQPVTH